MFADAWPHAIYCPECLAMVKSLKYGDEGKEDAARKWNRRATGKRDAKGKMIYAGDELGMRSTGKRGTVFYNAEDAAFEVKLTNGVCIGLDAEDGEYERTEEW